jgi:hypothetical protein
LEKIKMGALLALVPVKDWIYGGIIAALLAGFGYYTIHERDVQKAKDFAAAARAVAAANKKVGADNAQAQTTETSNALIYKQAVAIPPVGDLGIMCQHTGSSVSLSKADGVAATAAGNQSADSGSGPASFDPSGAILTRARDADAQIAYLQSRVKELEQQMNSAP